MDPDETLREIRDLTQRIEDTNDESETFDLAAALTERVRALDEWLSKGGFPPAGWRTSAVTDPTRWR